LTGEALPKELHGNIKCQAQLSLPLRPVFLGDVLFDQPKKKPDGNAIYKESRLLRQFFFQTLQSQTGNLRPRFHPKHLSG
jgi:hypothetical protein